jgi:anti-sigma factor RsiW
VSHDDDNVHHFSHVDCRRLVDLLGDYVDDQLPDAQRHAVDQHVGNCAPCTAFLRQYRFAPAAVRETLLRKVPVDLENRLLSFLRARTSKAPDGH